MHYTERVNYDIKAVNYYDTMILNLAKLNCNNIDLEIRLSLNSFSNKLV